MRIGQGPWARSDATHSPSQRIRASSRRSGAAMGIYDREYIRGEASGTGLFGGVMPVTKSIIAISVITFLLQNLLHLDSNGVTLEWLAASPEQTFGHFRLFQL